MPAFGSLDAQRRQLAVKAKVVGRKGLARIATVATPDTILRWYRRLVAQKYDGSAKRGPGRPRIHADIAALIVRMANENPRWGYTRILGALKDLELFVGRSTIARVLAEHGLLPAPERSKRTSWRAFLRAHWGAIAATDFFSVEVLTLHGLVRYFVLFVIDLRPFTLAARCGRATWSRSLSPSTPSVFRTVGVTSRTTWRTAPTCRVPLSMTCNVAASSSEAGIQLLRDDAPQLALGTAHVSRSSPQDMRHATVLWPQQRSNLTAGCLRRSNRDSGKPRAGQDFLVQGDERQLFAGSNPHVERVRRAKPS